MRTLFDYYIIYYIIIILVRTRCLDSLILAFYWLYTVHTDHNGLHLTSLSFDSFFCCNTRYSIYLMDLIGFCLWCLWYVWIFLIYISYSTVIGVIILNCLCVILFMCCCWLGMFMGFVVYIVENLVDWVVVYGYYSKYFWEHCWLGCCLWVL